MQTNVIVFKVHPKSSAHRAAPRQYRDNVISLANWIGRAMPHRTPNGVFFTTGVLVSAGDIA